MNDVGLKTTFWWRIFTLVWMSHAHRSSCSIHHHIPFPVGWIIYICFRCDVIFFLYFFNLLTDAHQEISLNLFLMAGWRLWVNVWGALGWQVERCWARSRILLLIKFHHQTMKNRLIFQFIHLHALYVPKNWSVSTNYDHFEALRVLS